VVLLCFRAPLHRFDPREGKTFEVLTNTSNNTWSWHYGRQFFFKHCNTPTVSLGIPNKIMEGLVGIPCSSKNRWPLHHAALDRKYQALDVLGIYRRRGTSLLYREKLSGNLLNKVAFV
jgi:hypothetical protein